MAERRKWDKQPREFPGVGALAGDGTADAKAADDAADPVLQKQRQYIKILEERNRLKKRLAETQTARKKERLQEREDAFVTAFNVPTRAAPSAATTRKTRSAAAALPAKMTAFEDSEQCKSTPTLALHSTGGGGSKPKTARAKWTKPQGPMTLAATGDHDGKTQFYLAETPRDDGNAETKDEDEEDYCEESFEEFDDEDEVLGEESKDAESVDSLRASRIGSLRSQAKEIVIDEEESCATIHAQSKDRADTGLRGVSPSVEEARMTTPAVAAHDQSTLGQTTRDLMGMIENLSRSKQHALMDVLQKFQSSKKQESDMRELRNSIGDPDIWKQLTATVLSQDSSSASPASSNPTGSQRSAGNRTPISALDQIMEEQRRWEEQYALEMKERLAKEREAKEAVLRQAEARRAAMMKQLEEEEQELEQLMEMKRRERQARMRAMEAESDDRISIRQHAEEIVAPRVDFANERATTKAAERKDRNIALMPDEKSSDRRPRRDAKDQNGTKDVEAGRPRELEPPVIPPLKLGASMSSPVLQPAASTSQSLSSNLATDVRVKLVSTWGRTRAIGLTQISAYDADGAEIEIDPATARLYDSLDGKPLPKTNDMVRGLHRLFNGIAHTNVDQYMWLGRLPESGVLQIGFELVSIPAKMCIWNYNAKNCAGSASACTRDVEILVNGKCMWTGSLPESYGDENDNPCSWISVMGNSKKMSRSTTLGEQSMAASYSNIPKAQTARAESIRESDSTSGERTPGNGPLWLSDARTTAVRGSLTARDLVVSDSRAADSKGLAMGFKELSAKVLGTSRRRLPSEQDQLGSDAKDTRSSREAVGSYNVERQDKLSSPVPDLSRSQETVNPLRHSNLAAMDAWDSLERFSKTNRSRLAAPTDATEIYDGDERRHNGLPDVGSSKTTLTTSRLLDDLKAGTYRTPRNTSDEVLDHTPLLSSRLTECRNEELIPAVVETPVLPSGRCLHLEILTTWGDPHYVGLNGIEIFDHLGELVSFRHPERQVTACPESVNVLEENENDPRVPKNLVDGVNFTCDDYHMWLAPFTAGNEHYVSLEMNSGVSISMVRVWNYNKSRAHTSRGVRHARLLLSDRPFDQSMSSSGSSIIFDGEICQAPGIVSSSSFESSNEVILFTREPSTLAAIEANDVVLKALAREQEQDEAAVEDARDGLNMDRPRTSDKSDDMDGSSRRLAHNQDDDELGAGSRLGQDGRPMTSASSRPNIRKSKDVRKADEPQQRSPVLAKVAEIDEAEDEIVQEPISQTLLRGHRIVLTLANTWGDRNYIGLTQLEVLVGQQGSPLRADSFHIDATPRDLATLGYHGDPRTLAKLVDGVSTTCDDTHMWLVPTGSMPEIRIDLRSPQFLFGLRIWNYNKSLDDTARGVKQIHVWVDGRLVSPPDTGFVLRKAPGTDMFDFGQVIQLPPSPLLAVMADYSARVGYTFASKAYRTPVVRQDYEPPLLPQGFVLKLVFWSTWGDPYYIGLNGFELFDATGRKINEKPRIVAATPPSVAEMAGGDPTDARVASNLLSGIDKNTWEAHDAWLAPLASSLGNAAVKSAGNVVYVVFDEPVVLSLIKFWNYGKTPTRGVRELDIYMDDLHVFSGTLRRAPDAPSVGMGGGRMMVENFGQPVLFTTSQALVDAEKRSVRYCGGEEQDVLCINDGQVVRESRAMYRRPDPGAEGVVVDLAQRPMTAMCRQ